MVMGMVAHKNAGTSDRQLDSPVLLSIESSSCCNNCTCDEAGDTCELYIRSPGQEK